MNNIPYASVIGLANWQIAKIIKCYLYGIVDLLLFYQEGDLKSREYLNVDWEVDLMICLHPRWESHVMV